MQFQPSLFKKYKKDSAFYNRFIVFIVFMIGTLFMLNRAVSPGSPTGIYELPKETVKLVVQQSFPIEKIDGLLDQTDLTVITSPVDHKAYIYDSGHHFTNSPGFYDDGSHTSKPILIHSDNQKADLSQFDVELPALAREGVQEVDNLFSLPQLESGSVLYVHSSHPVQMEYAKNLLEKAGCAASSFSANFPLLTSAVIEALATDAHSRLLFVPVWSLCLFVFLLAEIKKEKDKSSTPSYKIWSFRLSVELLLSLLFLLLAGFNWSSLRYAAEIVIMFEIVDLLISWMARLIIRHVPKTVTIYLFSIAQGILAGAFIVGGLVLLSSLMEAIIVRQDLREILFILSALLIPFAFSTFLIIKLFQEQSADGLLSFSAFMWTLLIAFFALITFLSLLVPASMLIVIGILSGAIFITILLTKVIVNSHKQPAS